MIDRSVFALSAAFGLLILQSTAGVNVFTQPALAKVTLGVALLTLAALWIRALRAIERGWADPSARVVRFSSVGALLLTFFPTLMLLADHLMPYEPDHM